MPDTLAGLADGVDCVFHLAARVADWGSMELFRDVITKGTANVLERSVGVASRFVYADNLVEGIVLAATSENARGRAYNFRDDHVVTWKQYLSELGSLVGKKPGPSLPTRPLWPASRLMELAYLPFFPARPLLSRMAVAVMGYDNDVDVARAHDELGWSTAITYDEAMRQVSDWVRRKYPSHYRSATA